MSRASFENFGSWARRDLSYTELGGRFSFQKAEEKNIVHDVVGKLDLNPSDDLLEIGCGPGNLLIPLCFLVNSATGMDHPNIIEKLRMRFTDPSLTLVPGNFLDVKLDRIFSKILIYSVVHYMSHANEFITFVQKAVDLLKPGGRLLVGDIPNMDKKRCFQSTMEGQRASETWRRLTESNLPQDFERNFTDPELVNIDDELVMQIIRYFRGKDLHAYVLLQPVCLPLCHTREDILLEKLPE